MKNDGFGDPKTRKIVEKTLPKAMVFSLVFLNGFWAGLGPILGRVGGPYGVPWVTFGDVFDVCMSISLQKGVPEALGAGFGLIFMTFKGFWGLFFVFLGGCRGGKSSVSSRRNACFCIFALQIQIANNFTKKRTSPC